MKKLLIFFSAGCLGGLANSITAWLFGHFGITSSFGVSIAPALTPAWLYPRLVWGGIWGVIVYSANAAIEDARQRGRIKFVPDCSSVICGFSFKSAQGYRRPGAWTVDARICDIF